MEESPPGSVGLGGSEQGGEGAGVRGHVLRGKARDERVQAAEAAAGSYGATVQRAQAWGGQGLGPDVFTPCAEATGTSRRRYSAFPFAPVSLQ